jgi:hypothetical protein
MSFFNFLVIVSETRRPGTMSWERELGVRVVEMLNL